MCRGGAKTWARTITSRKKTASTFPPPRCARPSRHSSSPGAAKRRPNLQTAAQELALANPFVEDQSRLRPTLITGLLESLKLNQSRGVVASRLFETGRIFVERNGQNLECAAVGFIIAEPVGDRAWLKREAAD